jgi:hypothetical protein
LAAWVQHKLQKLHPLHPNEAYSSHNGVRIVQEGVDDHPEALPKQSCGLALLDFQADRAVLSENASFGTEGALSGGHQNETVVYVISFFIFFSQLI